MAACKAVLAPRQVVRVGRGESADLRVPHDVHLADLHFELLWEGEHCELRALRSDAETLLNGEPVEKAEVSHGVWVRAGTTDLSVYFEGATPPPLLAEPESAELVACKARALQALEGEEGPLFAVLDAARDRRIRVLLHESIEEYRSLYEGPQGEVLAEVAPYLVRLPRGSRLLQALVQEGWGRQWGIYLASRLPLKEVRRHLRKFLMAEDSEGREVYFRFYDPRVLQVFLPSCALEQAREFFGDIGCFYMEGAQPDTLVTFTRGGIHSRRELLGA